MTTTNTALQDLIIRNATVTMHGSEVAAVAASMMGIEARSLCCDCAEHLEGRKVRLPRGGECYSCAETGRDVLLVFLE